MFAFQARASSTDTFNYATYHTLEEVRGPRGPAARARAGRGVRGPCSMSPWPGWSGLWLTAGRRMELPREVSTHPEAVTASLPSFPFSDLWLHGHVGGRAPTACQKAPDWHHLRRPSHLRAEGNGCLYGGVRGHVCRNGPLHSWVGRAHTPRRTPRAALWERCEGPYWPRCVHTCTHSSNCYVTRMLQPSVALWKVAPGLGWSRQHIRFGTSDRELWTCSSLGRGRGLEVWLSRICPKFGLRTST